MERLRDCWEQDKKQGRKCHVDQGQVSSETLEMSGPKTLMWSGKVRDSYEEALSLAVIGPL